MVRRAHRLGAGSRLSTSALLAYGGPEPGISDLATLQRTSEGHDIAIEGLRDLTLVAADLSDDRISYDLGGINRLHLRSVAIHPGCT